MKPPRFSSAVADEVRARAPHLIPRWRVKAWGEPMLHLSIDGDKWANVAENVAVMRMG